MVGPLDGSTPRARVDASWIVAVPTADARRRVLEAAARWGMQPLGETTDTLIFNQGSQVRTRALGAWLADPKHFPKRAVVRLTAIDSGTQIDSVIYETLGFAVFDPISKRRYEEYFASWTAALKLALPSVATGAAGSRSLDRLERLAELHARGVITDDDFEDQKRRILSG